MDGKILVPSSAVAWVHKELDYRFRQCDVSEICRVFCEWLSKNPILPTDEQLYSTIGRLPVAMCDIVWTDRDRAMIAEWQRRCFLAPEPEVPEEIKDLLWKNLKVNGIELDSMVEPLNKTILEAFRRGQRSK